MLIQFSFQGWNQAYQYNLRLYNARVHSYKNGNPLAKNMDDDEALKYADDYHVAMPELKDAAAHEALANDQDAIAEQLHQNVAAPASEEEQETPAKTPKKATGGRKRKTATPAAAEIETPRSAAPASPDKKRRRTSTKVADLEKEEPKKSGRKKTKSS